MEKYDGHSHSVNEGINLNTQKKDVIIPKKKEELSMSYMTLVYNNKNTTIATDSRITYKNKIHKDNRQKIYKSLDGKIIVGIIGLAEIEYQLFENSEPITIDISKEIANFLCDDLNIKVVLSKERLGKITYENLLEESLDDKYLNIFIAKENDFPVLIDIHLEDEMLSYNIKVITKKDVYFAGKLPKEISQAILNNVKLYDNDLKLQESKTLEYMNNVLSIAKLIGEKTIGGKIQIESV